jgi:hypothetical protein
VLDVEGADSRERGDADCLFERKSALFALALAEVLLVNVSQNDIGRYNASGMPLLKTVFEVNLQLFVNKTGEAKCHLLFVIRDVTQDHKAMERQVYNDLQLIWKQLVFPKEFQHLIGRPLEDFFIFHFFPMPHFVYQLEQFKESVGRLRAHFVDEKDPEFLFKTATGKIMPGDGLAHYICSVWDAVNQNRELNLPSQRKTLSIFKCDEFVKERLAEFTNRLASPEVSAVNSGAGIDNLGELVSAAFNDSIAHYDRDSAKYVPEVIAEKRDALKDAMKGLIPPLFNANCTRAIEASEARLAEWLSGFPQFPDSDWRRMADAERDSCIDFVQRRIATSRPADWALQFEGLENLVPKMDNLVNEKEEKLIVDFAKSVAQKWSAIQKEAIAEDLEAASPDMWPNLRAKLRANVQQAQEEFLERVTVNTRPGRRLDTHLTSIECALGRATHARALVASSNIGMKMQKHFDKRFSCDESGNPRTWTEDTDIAKLYEAARKECLEMLHRFAACQLREKTDRIPPNDPLTGTLIGISAMELIEEAFKRESEKKWINAVRVQDSNRNRTQVPVWMMILYGVLGIPKVIAAVKHPWISMGILLMVLLVVWLFQKGWLDRPIEVVKLNGVRVARWVVAKIVQKPKRVRKGRKKGTQQPGKTASPFDARHPDPLEAEVVRRTAAATSGGPALSG